MKNLPEVNTSFEELYRMLIGPIKSKLLLAGIELGVFNQLSRLSEPRLTEDVTDATGGHPGNMRLFLDGMTDSNLVLKNGFGITW